MQSIAHTVPFGLFRLISASSRLAAPVVIRNLVTARGTAVSTVTRAVRNIATSDPNVVDHSGNPPMPAGTIVTGAPPTSALPVATEAGMQFSAVSSLFVGQQ